jgi:hypothetical protein
MRSPSSAGFLLCVCVRACVRVSALASALRAAHRVAEVAGRCADVLGDEGVEAVLGPARHRHAGPDLDQVLREERRH